jgi:hypothetical protein
MVIFEAARAICNLKDVTARELTPAITVLQLFLSSSKPVLRFAAVRTLNKVRASRALCDDWIWNLRCWQLERSHRAVCWGAPLLSVPVCQGFCNTLYWVSPSLEILVHQPADLPKPIPPCRWP